MKESLITALLSVLGLWSDAPSIRPAAVAATTERDRPEAPAAADDETRYTCPMHPEVVRDEPGRCPDCGMKLEPKEDAKPKGNGHTRRFHAAEG